MPRTRFDRHNPHASFTEGRGISAAAAMLVLAAILGMQGCGADKEPPREPGPDTIAVTRSDGGTYSYQAAPGNRLDTLIRLPLPNGDTALIVMTMRNDSTAPASARADRLHALTREAGTGANIPEAGGYAETYTDSMQWCTAYDVRDVTGDRFPELVLSLDAGGNDNIATHGMAIYGLQKGRFGQIFRADHGAPAFMPIPPAGQNALAIHNELWPAFASHAEAVSYLDDILLYRGDAFVSVRTERTAPFMEQAATYLETYRGLRETHRADTLRPAGDSVAASDTDSAAVADSSANPGSHPLFTASAMVLISYGRAGELRSARAFWVSERDYLRKRIPADQFTELLGIYQRQVGA